MSLKVRRQAMWVIVVMLLSIIPACRNEPETLRPTAVVTVISATLEPTLTAVPQAVATEIQIVATPTTEAASAEPTPVSEPVSSDYELIPGVTAYNLGDATLVQDRFPEDSRFRNMPARLEGVISVPDGLDRPAPVVLIMHGNHRGCPVNPENTDVDLWPCPADAEQQNYRGFDYLVRALADQGYAALAINVNAEYSIGFGEPTAGERLVQLINEHLGALATAASGGQNDFGVELAGRVDLQRLVFMGHSQGGEFANRLVQEEGWDSPYSFVDNGFGPVDGMLLIAPSFNFIGSDGGQIPMAAILPACDGDVAQLTGQFFFEALRLDSDFPTWATTSLVDGANHNFFNRVLGPDSLIPVSCPTALTPEQQQAFLVDYSSTFLRAIWAGQPDQLAALEELGLDVTSPAPHSVAGIAARTVSTVPERLPLLVPVDESEVERRLTSGELQLDAVDVIYCEAGFDLELGMEMLQLCRRPNYNQPGQPSQLLVEWTDRSGVVSFNLPDDSQDVSRYSALSLRTVLDPLSDLHAPGLPQSLTVELVDGSGRTAQVIIPDSDPSLQFPPGEVSSSEFFAAGIWSDNVHMSDIRLPLTDFVGVDLSDIEKVVLVFDQTDSGALFLADVQFVRPSAAIGAYSTLLQNADGANDNLKAIGRLSGTSTCTATLIDTGGTADSPAYVITSGHCAQPWDANEVFQGQSGEGMTVTFNYFVDMVEQTIVVPVRQVAYSTMKGRDVAVVELEATLGELAAQDIAPLSLAQEQPAFPFPMRVVGVPVSGVPAELAFLREETCMATASVNLFEFIWHFDDAIRNSCQDIYGGSSGSPVFAGDDLAIIALINTSNIGGASACAAGVPCEIGDSGTILLPNTSYTTPIMGIDACFTGGTFDPETTACPLDDGRQLGLNGYPPQPIRPSSLGTDGQEVAATWNTIVSGDLPYYRFKIGRVGVTDCRSESGYSGALALANEQLIDEAIPPEEGSYVLCVVAGPTPRVDGNWQPVEWATIARAEIDTTPPLVEPYINILFLGDVVSIEPIFANPELVDFRLKVGNPDTTDCQSDDDYIRYRRIPIQVGVDELPIKVCVVGSDSAGNESAPVERVVAPR